jgi:dynein heavy chain, axonemal
MVYMEPEQMGWEPMFQSWQSKNVLCLAQEHSKMVGDFARWLFTPLLAFVRHNCTEAVPTSDLNLSWATLQLFDAIAISAGKGVLTGCKADAVLQGLFVLATTWSFGGAVDGKVSAEACRCTRMQLSAFVLSRLQHENG